LTSLLRRGHIQSSHDIGKVFSGAAVSTVATADEMADDSGKDDNFKGIMRRFKGRLQNLNTTINQSTFGRVFRLSGSGHVSLRGTLAYTIIRLGYCPNRCAC